MAPLEEVGVCDDVSSICDGLSGGVVELPWWPPAPSLPLDGPRHASCHQLRRPHLIPRAITTFLQRGSKRKKEEEEEEEAKSISVSV